MRDATGELFWQPLYVLGPAVLLICQFTPWRKDMPRKISILILIGVAAAMLLSPQLAQALPGDINGSGRVDGYDLISFGLANGSSSGDANWNPQADMDGNGIIDAADLNMLSTHFGRVGVSYGLWAANNYSDYYTTLRKISDKNNILWEKTGFNYPNFVAPDIADGSAWVSESNNSRICKVDGFDGSRLVTVNGVYCQKASVNYKDGSVWIADSSLSAVVRLAPGIPDGYNISTDTGFHKVITGFTTPYGISVDPENGIVWVADTGASRVVRLNENVPDGYNVGSDSGSHFVVTNSGASADMNWPTCVSANYSDGTVWVASTYNDKVMKFNSTGDVKLVEISGYSNPTFVQINPTDGSAWVIDDSLGKVFRYTKDGSLICEYSGVGSAKSLAVNPLDGSCWVMANSDPTIRRLSPNGALLETMSGIYSITSLAIVPDETMSRYPTAEASASKNAPDLDENVTFTGVGSDSDGQIVKYEWDFEGDGVFDYTSADTGTTDHSYDTPGIYTPIFRVTDNEYLTATDCSLVIRAGSLTAIAVADVVTGTAPLTVNFTGTFIDPVDGKVDTYQWDFDGDAGFEYYSETTGNVQHVYSEAGVYNAVFKVTDGAANDTESIQIMVSQSPPKATASATPKSGERPLLVNLTGTATDADGSVVYYEWDFDGDGTYDWQSTVNGQTSVTYSNAGTFSPVFRATDNDGLSDTDSVSIDVTLTPPVAVITSTTTTAYAPGTITFGGNSSTDADGSIATYEWNFDGSLGDVETAFFDDMETDNNNWEAESPWAIGSTDAYSGSRCWSTGHYGNYANNLDADLVFGPFDFTQAVTATLSFMHRMDMPDYDYVYVSYSLDDGASWSYIWYDYWEVSSGWQQKILSLDNYCGKDNVLFKFRFYSNSTTTEATGWWIDDVTVKTRGYAWTSTTNPTIDHQFTETGDYTVRLRVTDNDGYQDYAQYDVTIEPDNRPIANLSADVTSGAPGLTVNFTGSGQVISGTITSYQWNFGEEYVWVADYYAHEVVRLSSSSSKELARVDGFYYPYSVAVDSNTGRVWVADSYNDALVLLSADGRYEIQRITGFNYPSYVSVDESDGSVWLIDSNANKVFKYSIKGEKLAEYGGFSSPKMASINSSDGSVWIADGSKHRIVHLDSTGAFLKSVKGFSYPEGVAVNPNDGTIWVSNTSAGNVIRLDASVPDGYDISLDTGSHTVVGGISGPEEIVVDPTDNTVWVITPNSDKLIHISADGTTELSRSGSFYDPYYLALNWRAGQVWVSSYYGNYVTLLDEDGQEIRKYTGFNYPRDVDAAQKAGATQTTANGGSLSHTYDSPGVYLAALTVTTAEGLSSTDTVQITVRALPTVTAASSVAAGTAPLEVFLSADAQDLDGPIVLYEWDFDGDGSFDYSSPSVGPVRHVYSSGGVYNATVKVTDADGNTATDSLTITVSDANPVAYAQAAPKDGSAPLTVAFSGSGSDADGQIVKYEWDFTSDGSYEYSSTSTASANHVYNSDGTYTATLRVTDDDGLTGTDTVSITVSESGSPKAMLDGDPTRGQASLDVCVFIHGQDPDGSISSYSMDYDGDGLSDADFATPPTAFGDDAELDYNNGTATGTWSRTTEEAHSGSYSWTDSPNGDFDPSTDYELQSNTIDLSAATAPKLVYWEKYALADSDYIYTYVSGNDGGSWTQLYYTGHNVLQNSWTRREFDLSSYAGNSTVKIKFRILANSGTTADGWYLDDVFVGDCVSHTYSAPGAYQAILTVTDNEGKTATAKEAIAVLSSSDDTFIWVADTSHDQVKKYNREGDLLATITGFDDPFDVEVDPATSNVWVSDRYKDRLVLLDAGVFDAYDVNVEYTIDDVDASRYGGIFGSTSVITATGRFNNGLDTGDGGYILAPYDPSFDVQSFTYEAWIKPISTGRALFMRTNAQGGNELLVWLYDADTIQVTLDDSNYYFDGSGSFLDGSYHHVAVVHDADADTVTCYVDGTQFGIQKSVSKTLNFSRSHLLIGADFDGYNSSIGDFYKGLMDDVRFWNVARSSGSISTYMNSELNGTEAGLVSYWKMENSSVPFHKIATGVDECLRISVDPADGSVWAADHNHGRVVKYDVNGVQQAEVIGLGGPEGVDVDPVNRTLWITDTDNDRVISMTADFTGTVIGGMMGSIEDSTSNGNDAVILGDVSIKSGQFSNSVYLDGSGDCLMAPSDASLDVQNFTVEAWFSSKDVAYRSILMRGNSSSGDEMYVQFTGSSSVRVYVNDTYKNFTGGFSIQDGLFHHIAVVYDSSAGTIDCYMDGEEYGSTATGVSGPLDFAESNLLIGAFYSYYNSNIGNYWNGKLDDVRLWNKTRTKAEIQSTKDSALTGSEDGLVGYWKMDVEDSSLRSTVYTGMDGPVDVCAYHADGGAWAAVWNGDQLVKCQPGSSSTRAMNGFDSVASVSVNQNNGQAWAADYYQQHAVKVSPTYSELVRKTGIVNPYDMEVDQQTGNVWVVEYNGHVVVELAPDGTELKRLTGLYYPRAVSIDNGSKDAGNPPQATASASPLSGDAPLDVSFTGTGTDDGSITLYEWDFDNDGVYDYSSASTGSTSYTFSSPGYYNPVLRVTDDDGMTGYNSSVNIVVGPPRVECSAIPASGTAPLTTRLNAFVVGLGLDVYPETYEWDVDSDGVYETAPSVNPYYSYKYQTGADWVATCRVTDSNGDQHFGSVTVPVAKTPPIAYNYATPTSGNAPLTVTLDGGGSDSDGSLVRFEWDYDGDGVYDWISETSMDASFTYTTAGTYNTVFRVTDNEGLTATATKTVTVGDSQVKPIVTAEANPVEGNVSLTVNFSGSAVDPDEGVISLYEWDFDGDGNYDYSSPTDIETSHIYSVPGSYNARLRATDQDGLQSTDDVFITVKAAGVPNAVANAAPTSGDIPLSVSFDAEGSSDPDGSIAKYEWSFGAPGVWIASFSNDLVKQLKGYSVENEIGGYDGPWDVAVDPNDGSAWVSMRYSDKVVKYDSGGSGVLMEVTGFDDPRGVDVTPSDSSVWIADCYHDQVVKLSSNGSELLRIGGFNDPQYVMVDPWDDSVWVTDWHNSKVVNLDSGGVVSKTYYGFNHPLDVVLDEQDRSVWVSDHDGDRVVKFPADTPATYDSYRPYRADSGPNNLFANNAGDVSSMAGKLSEGLYVDGSYDYLRIPSNSALDLYDFTVEAWVVADSANARCLYMRGDNTGGNELYFGVQDSDSLTAVLDNGNNVFFDGAANFTDGQFHHVALTFDADAHELKAYVDGAQYGDAHPITATLDFGNSDALIGADFDTFNGSVGNFWDGVIDEVRIWNIVRTQEEINGAKDAEIDRNEAGLVAYYTMNIYHAAVGGVNGPHNMAINPADQSIWIPDYYNNQMVRVNKDCTQELLRVSGFSNPAYCYLAPGSQNVWVSDYGSEKVYVIDGEGNFLKTFTGFYDPFGIDGYVAQTDYFSSQDSGNTTHSYPDLGEYVATLTVTDNDGNTDTDSVVIRAGVFPESLPGAYPTTGTAPMTVTFISNAYSPTGTIEYFMWDFNGDGVLDTSTGDWDSRRTSTRTYTYSLPGTYTASLTVTDNRGYSDTATVTINVLPPNEDGAPQAFASASPQEGNSPLEVEFNGFGKDLDGFIRKFEWDFTTDGTYDFTSTSTGATTNTYNAVGEYTATLRVTDDSGKTDTDSVKVWVKEIGAPTAHADATPTSGETALAVTFSGSADDAGTIVLYEWDFEGDGTYDYSSAASPNTTHTYNAPGSYDAVLRVTDNDGLQDTDTVNINASAGITASLSRDQFDPALGTVSINSVLTAQCKVTIYIKDRVGAVVRKLVDQAVRNPGYYSDAWDGKDDSGDLVRSGVYLFTIDYEAGGLSYTYDVTGNVNTALYYPSVVYPATFNPFSADTNFFRYTLDGKSEVTVYIAPFSSGAGTRVKTLVMRKPQKGGSYVLVWDGTNDIGNLVDPGNYVIAVFGWHLPPNAIIVNNLPVVADLTVTPTYLNPDVYPYDDQYQATFGFNLSKVSDITVNIFDEDNYIVRTVTASDVPAGAVSSMKWDGKNDAGNFVPPGVYRIKVIATDSEGNKSEDANALLIVFY